MKSSEHVSPAEAASRLGISRSSAYTRIKAGDIPSVKRNGRTVVPTAWLDEQAGEAGNVGAGTGPAPLPLVVSLKVARAILGVGPTEFAALEALGVLRVHRTSGGRGFVLRAELEQLQKAG